MGLLAVGDHRQHQVRGHAWSAEYALGCWNIIGCCRLVNTGYEFLRIAVDDREPRGLYLHHQAVAFKKSIIVIAQRNFPPLWLDSLAGLGLLVAVEDSGRDVPPLLWVVHIRSWSSRRRYLPLRCSALLRFLRIDIDQLHDEVASLCRRWRRTEWLRSLRSRPHRGPEAHLQRSARPDDDPRNAGRPLPRISIPAGVGGGDRARTIGYGFAGSEMYCRYAGPLLRARRRKEFRLRGSRGWSALLASGATRCRCARCSSRPGRWSLATPAFRPSRAGSNGRRGLRYFAGTRGRFCARRRRRGRCVSPTGAPIRRGTRARRP